MNINWQTINTNFNGETCFTHARGLICENGFGLITTQPLRLSGSDVFYGMHITTTHDGGKTWSELVPSNTVVRHAFGENMQAAMSDATPMYHKKTGKIILIGHYVIYLNDELLPPPRPRFTTYAVYDEKTGDFSPLKFVEMPQDENESYFSSGNGCGQSWELENGDLLIPISHMCKADAKDPWHKSYNTSAMRCSFDGETIKFLEIGNNLTVDVPRGLGEGSIMYHNGEYFMSLRNDKDGYVTKGFDGLHYADPKPLVFDDGCSVGNYCTQQHWITGGGKLYLVYTRRGADNDHVFRHRAPLFIAEFDTEKMCVIRETEQIAVPNRGARLGNFGCMSCADGKTAYIFASEWMQTTGPDPFDWRVCASYGSDNSIFISKITF